MCIIILNKTGTLPDEQLENAFDNNTHGAGLAYAKDGKIKVFKTMERAEIISEYKKVKAKGVETVLLHFRIATQGGKTIANTHPFFCKDNVVMAHNGIIRINYFEGDLPKVMPEDPSDSVEFAHFIKKNFRKDFMYRTGAISIIHKLIGTGSKLVFLDSTGHSVIVNEKEGNWDTTKSNWYSNLSHTRRKVVYDYSRNTNFTSKPVEEETMELVFADKIKRTVRKIDYYQSTDGYWYKKTHAQKDKERKAIKHAKGKYRIKAWNEDLQEYAFEYRSATEFSIPRMEFVVTADKLKSQRDWKYDYIHAETYVGQEDIACITAWDKTTEKFVRTTWQACARAVGIDETRHSQYVCETGKGDPIIMDTTKKQLVIEHKTTEQQGVLAEDVKYHVMSDLDMPDDKTISTNNGNYMKFNDELYMWNYMMKRYVKTSLKVIDKKPVPKADIDRTKFVRMYSEKLPTKFSYKDIFWNDVHYTWSTNRSEYVMVEALNIKPAEEKVEEVSNLEANKIKKEWAGDSIMQGGKCYKWNTRTQQYEFDIDETHEMDKQMKELYDEMRGDFTL